eukprot:scaffold453_cov243-Pinguiococcus_pyrenoidosus.AAC.8
MDPERANLDREELCRRQPRRSRTAASLEISAAAQRGSCVLPHARNAEALRRSLVQAAGVGKLKRDGWWG